MNKLPYFETKVVKVKKAEKKKLYCPVCNSELEREKPLGNWVNGENIDKIKFPVPCRYTEFGENEFHYGILSNEISRENDKDLFSVIRIDGQANKKSKDYQWSLRYTNKSLKELIDIYDIHILKGKILIFEEEE